MDFSSPFVEQHSILHVGNWSPFNLIYRLGHDLPRYNGNNWALNMDLRSPFVERHSILNMGNWSPFSLIYRLGHDLPRYNGKN
jgi:hypothetical protein